ncbi:DUF4160 domain-containing protein [Acinetobacter soli]|uniref:DUF4160 domain-containing protein n=1 Tax=Acinetobacter soli TaxID=487316 RepID=UPI0026E09D23|nr:DUF4160 domain-containing protein [Acinetobacter soli]
MEEWSEYMENEVQELQKKLAQIDLIMEPKKSNKNAFLEILLLKLKNIKIKMYQEHSHNLPHIHIDYNDKIHAASYAIQSGEKIEGSISKKYDKEISNWIFKNQDNLIKIWELLQKGNDPEIVIEKLV